MKITDIGIHVLKTPLAEPFAFSQGWVRQCSATLVEVSTDQGITGWGEAFAQGLGPPDIAATVIDKALRPLVMGAVPVAHHSLYAQEPVLEYDRSSHPFRQELIRKPIQHVDGWITIPSKPGLGVEIDRAVLARYRADVG
ncbi:MAG: hypothetical protein P8Z80_10415 [Pseudolabrys sp.]